MRRRSVPHSFPRPSRGVGHAGFVAVRALVGLLSAGVSLSACHTPHPESRAVVAARDIRLLRNSSLWWVSTHAEGRCPTTRDLSDDRAIDETCRTSDPWGVPYTVRCDGPSIVVRSAGPDRALFTADDLVVEAPRWGGALRSPSSAWDWGVTRWAELHRLAARPPLSPTPPASAQAA